MSNRRSNGSEILIVRQRRTYVRANVLFSTKMPLCIVNSVLVFCSMWTNLKYVVVCIVKMLGFLLKLRKNQSNSFVQTTFYIAKFELSRKLWQSLPPQIITFQKRPSIIPTKTYFSLYLLWNWIEYFHERCKMWYYNLKNRN